MYFTESELENEIWKDIPGYEGYYQVSDLGRVCSLDRIVVKSNGVSLNLKGKVLIGTILKTGYIKINLYVGSKEKQFLVHQLVAMAFLNHMPDGTNKIVVDHKDNIRTNNRLSNLQLITNRENSSKDKKGGTSKYVGVNWNKAKKKFESRIRYKGRLLFLGLYDNEYDASLAYQKKLSEINILK